MKTSPVQKRDTLRVFLLRHCPYSEKLATFLSSSCRRRRGCTGVQVEWVTRDQKEFDAWKRKYNHPTYPIVVFDSPKRSWTTVIGGYSDLMRLLS